MNAYLRLHGGLANEIEKVRRINYDLEKLKANLKFAVGGEYVQLQYAIRGAETLLNIAYLEFGHKAYDFVQGEMQIEHFTPKEGEE